jgi:hypothetical protein
MSLSKSKCLYSNNCLQFLKCALPLGFNLVTYKKSSGLYYKNFTIVIYNRNAIGQYYKTTIAVMANYNRS